MDARSPRALGVEDVSASDAHLGPGPAPGPAPSPLSGSRAAGDLLARAAPRLLALLCLAYLLLEVVYARRVPFVMDELHGAATVLDLRSLVPYRDFAPYKTVLGYYLQLPVLALVGDTWERLVVTRIVLAALTAGSLLAGSLLLTRWFRREAVVLALGLLLATSTFLERSAELRVDMLTSLVGFFALLALLARRPALAGLLASASFLVSQKGVYFVAGVAVAVTTRWLFLERDRRGFRAVALCAAGGLAPLALYLGAWSLVSSPEAVLRATFLSHFDIALGDLYDLDRYWRQTFWRNPLVHAVALLGLGRLFAGRGRGERAERDGIVLSWSATVLLGALWHAQPWPYFFVLIHPTLFVLGCSFFDAELVERGRIGRVLLAACLVFGVAWPLSRVPGRIARDQTRQRATVRLAEALVPPGGPYLAGLRLLPERRHVVAEQLDWLDAPRLRRLQDDGAGDDLVARLAADPPRVVVWSYRLAGLPEPVRAWVLSRYAGVAGLVLVPAPSAPPGRQELRVDFAGPHRVSLPEGPGGQATVDGQPVSHGDLLEVSAGAHVVESAGGLRLLAFVPGAAAEIEEAAAAGRGPLFDGVYD